MQTSRIMGQIMHTEGRLASVGRDWVIRQGVKHDLILKIAERELLQECPVPITSRGAAGGGGGGTKARAVA